MQWSDEPGGGFSQAPGKAFPRPLPDGDFGPAAVNVAAQRTDPASLLNWFERMIRRRRETTELALGQAVAVPTEPVAVFAQRCTWQGSSVVTVHNLGPDPVEVDIPLGEDGDEAIIGADDLLETAWVEAVDRQLSLKLDGYGYRWLRPRREGDRRTP
jgi:glycosidase